MEGLRLIGSASTRSRFGQTSRCNFGGRRGELPVMSALRLILFCLLLSFAFAGPVTAASGCGDCPDQCGTDPAQPCAAPCPAICAAPCSAGCIIGILGAAQHNRESTDLALPMAARHGLSGGFTAGPEPPPPRSAALS